MGDYDVFQQQEAARSRRAAQAENLARKATHAITFTTTGAGYLVVQQPFLFGVRFLTEPTFSHGAALVTPPDKGHYRLPVSTAGVIHWETEPNPTDPKNPFFIGAQMYFNVLIVPLATTDLFYVASNPGVATVNHHLLFQAVAMKTLPDRVMQDLNSGSMDTNTPTWAQS